MKLRIVAAGAAIGAGLLLMGCPGPEPGPVAPTDPPPVDTPAQDQPPADPLPAGAFNVIRGADDADERGWRAEIVIALDGEDIVSVDYDEYDETGQRKSMAEAYAERWMEQVPGMHPARAYKQLETQLIDTNSPDEIDAISGATGSSQRFIAVAEQALGQ